MTEYVCLTVVAHSGEPEPAFKSRLTAFWTHMLRNRPDSYERVYAEATRFALHDGRIGRQYLVEEDAAGDVTTELASHGLGFAPVDGDDTYSKYEATSPDWFQIKH